jgi:tetratricopeptide (TPR) repeat protein
MKKYPIFILIILSVLILNAVGLKDADALFIEGQSFYNSARYKEAIKAFNEALSLYEKIEPANKLNRGYIDIWLGASYFKLKDMDNSIKYYEESISILTEKKDNKNLLNAINAISNTYLALKNYSKIIEYYKIAVSISDEVNKAVYLSYIGTYNYYLKNYKESIEYYLKAVDVYKQIKNDREVFNNLNNAAGVYFYSGDKISAVEYYKQAYEIGKSFLSDKEAMPYINNIATIFQEINNYDEAVNYFLIIADIAKSGNNKNDLFNVYYNIGLNYYAGGKKESALEYYKLAYDIAGQVNDEKNKIIVLNKIAIIKKDLKDYKGAIDIYLELEKIHNKNNSQDELALTYNSIGLVYNESKDYESAIIYYSKAQDIAGKIKDLKLQNLINFNIGFAYFYLDQYRDSIKYFKQFIESDKKQIENADFINSLSMIGFCYYHLNDFDNSLKYYNEAEKLAISIDDKDWLLIIFENTSDLYSKFAKYDDAFKYYNKALDLALKINKKDRYAVIMNNIGALYISLENYDKAIEYYNKAQSINIELGILDEAAIQDMNIGQAYYTMSAFDKALVYLEKSLKYFKESDNKEKYSNNLNILGELYRLWGKYDKAFDCYNEALNIALALNSKDIISSIYNNFGMLYKAEEDYNKALEYFNKALAINKEGVDRSAIAINYSNIGETNRLIGNYDEAIKYFFEALKIDKEQGNKSKIANRLNGIALLYAGVGDYVKSNDYLIEALQYTETSNKYDKSTYYHNIGYNYCFLKDFDKAIDYLTKSIAIKDELRDTATGEIRMDYLASQIITYELLIYTYASAGKPEKALEISETSRAKYLTEKISGKQYKDFIFPGINKILKNIDNDTIVISFTNVGKYYYPLRIIIANGKITAKELDIKLFKIKEQQIKDIQIVYKKSRGIKMSNSSDSQDNVIDKNNMQFYDYFSKMIYYYRTLLSNPGIDFKKDLSAKELSKTFYDFLLGDIYDIVKTKKKIIIIPDNVLGLLPFETLIDNNGNYLVENHDIRYSQSLTVLNLIKDRRYNSINRLPVIAFGGAVYDSNTYKSEIALNENEYDKLLKETIASLKRGQSRADIYDLLKNTSWKNLPGTLMEVKSIKNIFGKGTFYTGDKVSEQAVKDLSKSGELKKYKIIHFATHGLVIPDYPELSALVLSLSAKINNKEDGYLQSGEIAGLNLNADFVNLSACETGLGKIYGGEGIVGLTQSFLIAGANGVSVSLWQVADESTMMFMSEFYKLVHEKQMSYYEAESEVKRMFIKDKKFSNPFFWAPFVYYGM